MRHPRRGDLAAYPGLSARTRRFSLGRPRNVRVSPDGRQVLFLRSTHGEDPVNRLWRLDVASGEEQLLADPQGMLEAEGHESPPQERARRERARETGGGIVAYATDRGQRRVAFALAGRVFVVDVPSTDQGPRVREIETPGPAVEPRPDPPGRRLAYVVDGALHISHISEEEPAAGPPVVADDDPDVTWGLAEFIAAEEMGRTRGYWWDDTGRRLAVARVDTSEVERWYVSAPADPDRPPEEIAYPAAGTPNAEVSLWVVDASDGSRVEVRWDREAFPYLARVRWGRDPLTLQVQSRDQRRARVLVVDPDTGEARVVREDTDPAWVELIAGTPAWTPDGRLITIEDDEHARRVRIDGAPITPARVQVRRLLHVGDRGLLVAASTEPTEIHVLWLADGGTGSWRARWLTEAPGVHSATAGGGVAAISSFSPSHADVTVVVGPLPDLPDGGTELDAAASAGPAAGWSAGAGVRRVASFAHAPPFRPEVRLLRLGARHLRAALLLPTGGERLPVLLDPYGGPHAQRVLAAGGAHLTSRWFAEHGFAVLVVDGRGTPGRGPGWERAVHGDLAGPVLEDQVEGTLAAAEQEPRLDLGRVAIRGWSFGGTLAALAVLRRPDIFHAAVAGAPVTDWHLYDTHYTERYLGHPGTHPDAYRRSSILEEAGRPADRGSERPLLLIHGMADDNVVAAHSLRLSHALFGSGRRHAFLPLSGVTHMTPQETVATRLLEVQLEFLRNALGVDP